jgi:tetratricopeptide (TPR) repeat protein
MGTVSFQRRSTRIILRGLAFALFLGALSACSSAVPLPPKALELNRLGAAALGAGDLPTAEARLALAIEFSPKFTEAWVNLGLVALRRGDVKEARKDIGHARSLNPDLPAPHHALGLLEEHVDRLKQAEASYRAALAVDPGFGPARANLGRMLFAAGRYDDAREQFLRLTEVAPEVLDGWLGLVESLGRLDRERDGDLTIGRARRLFGDRPELVLLVARQMLRRGAFEEAETMLAPLTLDGDAHRCGSAWAWLGVARLGQGRPREAALAAEEALQSNPADTVARFVLERIRGAADVSAASEAPADLQRLSAQ